MKVKLNTNNQTNFQAKISPKFEKIMRYHINKSPNKLKNNYRLNKKIAEFNEWGYDNYTVELLENYAGWGRKYAMMCVPEGVETQKGIFIDKQYTVRDVVKRFLSIKKGEFINIMNRKWKLHK